MIFSNVVRPRGMGERLTAARRRTRVAITTVTAVVAGSAAVLSAPAATAAPAATDSCLDGTTPALLNSVSCTTAGNYTLGVPDGTTDVDVQVVGAGGGAGYPARQHLGGNAAQVTGNLTLPQGTSYLYVIVGAGGGGNNNGYGYGGGGSGILALDADHNLIAKLAIAGAGGGGSYNGDGGNAGSAGTSEHVSFAQPGLPANGAIGGAGGVGNYNAGTVGASNNPGAATIAAGGAGGVYPNGSAGGSGGGGYAGGGGGAAGSQGILNVYTAGGAGGSSFSSAYLAGAAISLRPGSGGIQKPGLVAGDGATGSVTMTFNGLAAPGAPTGVTAQAGNGQAEVSFTGATDDGGSAITGYTATSKPGNHTATCTASPCTVTGLTNGTAYTFTVVATNGNGNSPASDPSTAVTPATVPGSPTGVTAQPGNGQAPVSFTAPASNGGSAITSYTVTAKPGNHTATCPSSPCTVTGLTNGTTYAFTVAATNANGDSANSEPSTAVTPATVPGAPTGVTAQPGNGQAEVSFTAPASNGGSAITSYTVTANPSGKTAICASSPCTVTGLTNGTTYAFTVVATNAQGDSPKSAMSSTVKPAASKEQWYLDPLSRQERMGLARIPSNPRRATGPVRATTAQYRTFDGTLAVPAHQVHGHQLGAGQGVQVTGLFRFNSARLTPAGRHQLVVLSGSMKQTRAITCEGYADYAGNLRNEKRLAKKRAQQVCMFLKRRTGVQTRAIGYGPKRPALIGGTAKKRDVNRRVALLIRR